MYHAATYGTGKPERDKAMQDAPGPATRPEQPELLILTPLDPEEPSFLSFVERCIERGYFVEFDSKHRLPASLPEHLDGYKAIILDPRLGWTRVEPFRSRLDAFVARGGIVETFERIEPFSRELDNPMRSLLDCRLRFAGVTPHHTGLRARLGSQPDRALLRGLVDTIFDPRAHQPVLEKGKGVPERFTSVGDVGSYWSRRPTLLAGVYLGDDEVIERLRHWVDRLMAFKDNPPVHFDGISDAATFLYFHRRTGDDRYLRYVRERVDRVLATSPRLHGVLARPPLLTCEAAAMLAPSLTALGAYVGEDRYTAEALRLLRVTHEHLFDPEVGLWFHGASAAGEKAAAKWGRGQGWALYGVAHTLEVLPASHPERAWLCERLDEAARALHPLQDQRTGCWRNVLTDPASGLESSATSIYVEVFAQAWKEGWCRLDFVPQMVQAAWFGLKCRTFRHRTVGWVPGTSISPDRHYYVSRPRVSQPAFILAAAGRYLEAFGP